MLKLIFQKTSGDQQGDWKLLHLHHLTDIFPCEGSNCARVKTKIENLLDLNSDPCDDFYKFACNVANRGKSVPPVKEPLLTFEQLVETPPEGFDYVKRFYRSCTAITTQTSSSKVLALALT